MAQGRGLGMQTRITKLLGIQHPIVLPGMSWISKPQLVAAVSNAGGLGILATGPLSAKETGEAIREIRRLTNKPFGIGCTLMMPGAKENCLVALGEEVPVINYSLGKGDWLAERAHGYGGKVIATVTTAKHAQSAKQSGADALQVTGACVRACVHILLTCECGAAVAQFSPAPPPDTYAPSPKP